MVHKILLVDMAKSFANYLCEARILLNEIIHVSGISRSSINCASEAEVVLIGTIIAPEKIWGFCCCCWAYLHFFFLELIEWGLLMSPYFGCLTVIREWQSGRAVPASLTAPCPMSPQAGFAGIQEGLPRQGAQAREVKPAKLLVQLIFNLILIFLIFFPACKSSSQIRFPALAALRPASFLLRRTPPNLCQSQKLT